MLEHHIPSPFRKSKHTGRKGQQRFCWDIHATEARRRDMHTDCSFSINQFLPSITAATHGTEPLGSVRQVGFLLESGHRLRPDALQSLSALLCPSVPAHW